MYRCQVLRRVLVFACAVLATGCSEKPRAPVDATAPDAQPEMPANVRVALSPIGDVIWADRAVTAAQERTRREMENPDAWVALGHAWVDRAKMKHDPQDLVSADACASVVLAKDPDHVAAADLRGTVLRARGQWIQARQLAERVTQRHPEEALGWQNLTDVLLDLGRYEPAADAAKKLHDLGPSAASWSRVARLQWLNGDVAGAKRSLDAGNVILERGIVAWHEGDYAGADAAFDKALESKTDVGTALIGKGRVAMARNAWDLAVGFFQQAYDIDGSVESAWLLGDAREAGGDAKGAADAYALVEKASSRDGRTYSRFLTMRKDRTKKQIAEALRLASEEHVKRVDVYTEDALAWALYRAGMIETAKTSMGRARQLRTPDALIMFHEGAIRIAGGDVKKGKELLTKALATNRAFDWRGAKEARELLTR